MTYNVQSNLFVRNGGIARISMSIGVGQGGAVNDRTIEFVASDCTGVSVVSKALSFSVNMLQIEKKVAELDNGTVVSDQEVVAVADTAPALEGERSPCSGPVGTALAPPTVAG